MKKEEMDRLFGEVNERVAKLENALAEEKGATKITLMRVLWEIGCGIGGAFTAFWLRNRLPSINHTASAVTGVKLMNMMGVDGPQTAIVGTGFGIASGWGHDNFPMLEVIPASYGYQQFYSTVGECIAEHTASAYKALKDAKITHVRQEEKVEETQEEPAEKEA